VCRDVEADSLAFVQKFDLGRQLGAMHEHVSRTVVSCKEAESFGLVEEFNLARDAHVLTPSGWRELSPWPLPRCRNGGIARVTAWRHVTPLSQGAGRFWERRAQFCKARMRARDAAPMRRCQTSSIANFLADRAIALSRNDKFF
jgi:hypothetical protein